MAKERNQIILENFIEKSLSQFVGLWAYFVKKQIGQYYTKQRRFNYG
jgi:hypothetical protein